EDGIRDRNVTGVQTCALPISRFRTHHFFYNIIDYNWVICDPTVFGHYIPLLFAVFYRIDLNVTLQYRYSENIKSRTVNRYENALPCIFHSVKAWNCVAR